MYKYLSFKNISNKIKINKTIKQYISNSTVVTE